MHKIDSSLSHWGSSSHANDNQATTPRRSAKLSLRSLTIPGFLRSVLPGSKDANNDELSPKMTTPTQPRERHIEDDGSVCYKWKAGPGKNEVLLASSEPVFTFSSSEESSEHLENEEPWALRLEEDVRQWDALREKERKRQGKNSLQSSSAGSGKEMASQPGAKTPDRASRVVQANNECLEVLKALEKAVSHILARQWQAEGQQTADALLAGLTTTTRSTLIKNLTLAEEGKDFHKLTEAKQKRLLRTRVGKALLMSVANDLATQIKPSGMGKLESLLEEKLSVRFNPRDFTTEQKVGPDLLDQLVDLLVESSVVHKVSKTIVLSQEHFHPAYWQLLHDSYLVSPKFKESVEINAQHKQVSATFQRDFAASIYRYRSANGKSIAIDSIDEFINLTGKHAMPVSHLACQNLSLFLSRALFSRIKPNGHSDSALHLANGTPVTPTDRLIACYELSHNLDGTISLDFTGTIDTHQSEIQANRTHSVMKHTAWLHKPENEQHGVSLAKSDDISTLMENLNGERVTIRKASVEIKVRVDFDDHGQHEIGQIELQAQGWDQVDDSV